MSLLKIDVESLKIAYRNPRIHLKPVSAMITYEENMLATGDEDGIVKIWDMRQEKECFSLHDNEDFISDMSYNPGQKLLLAAGGGGYLSVFNPRKGRLEARSDHMDDELLSVKWICGGKNAIVGTTEGVLNFWKAGDWGNISTRFPGHPESVDSIVVIDEHTVVTGSSDGMLRIVSCLPNQLLGLVGEHGDFPIESVRMSRNKNFLASASHDNRIKFWNIDYLFEDEEDEGEQAPMEVEEMEEVDNSGRSVGFGGTELSKKKEKKKQFFSGLE